MYQLIPGRAGMIRRVLGLTMVIGTLAATVALAGPSNESNSIEPDFATTVPGTSLIGEGNVQIEANLARASDGEGTQMTRVWTTPTLLRLGMPNYEIRLQSSVYSRERTYNTVTNGMSDMTFGIKGVLPQNVDRNLSLAVVLQAAFPSGSSHFKQNGVRPEAQFIGGWTLPNHNTLGAVAGVRSDVDAADQRFANGVLGVNFAHGWNPRVSSYGEVAAEEIRSASRGGKNIMWTLGSAWKAMPGTQLDASMAFGVKDNDTDFRWKLGVTRRFRPPSPGSMSKREEQKPEETPSATTEDGK